GTLSFWYYPGTIDTITYDWQDAYVTNAAGTVLATIMHVCQNTQAWTNVIYNMAAFAGQTVRIKFLVHQDGYGDDTYMYVDDASLAVTTGCTTSTATATLTPTSTPTRTFTQVPPTNT